MDQTDTRPARHPPNIQTAAGVGKAKMVAWPARCHSAEMAGREGHPARMNEKTTPRPRSHSRVQNRPRAEGVLQGVSRNQGHPGHYTACRLNPPLGLNTPQPMMQSGPSGRMKEVFSSTTPVTGFTTS
jgi:hypothetical protein